MIKLRDVAELSVNASKTHIRDLVHLAEFAEHHFADFERADLLFHAVVELLFHKLDDAFHLLKGHRSFLAGSQDSCGDLLPVERFALAVAFDDHNGNLLDDFEGGKAVPALETLTASPNGIAARALARVNNLAFQVAAERTQHL